MGLDQVMARDAAAIAEGDGADLVYLPAGGQPIAVKGFVGTAPPQPRRTDAGGNSGSSGGRTLEYAVSVQIPRSSVARVSVNGDKVTVPGIYTEEGTDQTLRVAVVLRSRNPAWWLLGLR